MDDSAHPRPGHLPTLDGWRGIAILAVLCSHTRWPLLSIVKVGRYGAMGVHLFFALSGFLITWRLIEERRLSGRVDWKNFYIRRVFRILPAAFVYLGAVALLGFAFHLIPVGGLQLTGSALFFRNYLAAPVPEPWYTLHFWSLAVEEHFYLLWPLLLWSIGFRSARWIAPLLAIAVGIWRALDGRYQWIASLDPLLKDNVRRTDYRLDILLWGCVLALVWAHPVFQAGLRRIAGSALVVAVLAVTAVCLYYEPPAYLAILAVLMALLPATVGRPDSLVSRVLESRILTWIGRISFSLYLWQQLFFPVFGVEPSLGWFQAPLWNLIPSFAAAALSYYIVERPCIAYGKRIQRRRAAESRGAIAAAV